MTPTYTVALPQIEAQINAFLDSLNVSIPPHREVCIELLPGRGDGIVTGTVKFTIHCDLQVADWLISGAQGAGQPGSTEAG